MAINVNTVYQTVLSILNKESRGFLTPDEFKRIGAQVQLDILDQNFYDYNKAVVRHNAGRAVEDYGDIPEKIQQKIDPFYKTSDITLVAGKITIPSDVYKIINVTTTDKLLQIEKVNKKNLSYLLSSPLTKPTTSFPVYYQTDTEFVTNPTLTGDLTVEYIKTPDDPVWNKTTDSNGAMTYSSSGSTNFTLHESDRVQLVIGILKYAGLVIADPSVIQAASGEENKTIQLENS